MAVNMLTPFIITIYNKGFVTLMRTIDDPWIFTG